MSDIVIAGPVAYLHGSQSSVYFSPGASSFTETNESGPGTTVLPKEIQADLQVAPWGEDNKFPQNIQKHLDYCGIAKSALDWKAPVLYGSGIIPGKIDGYEDEGKKEIFVPLDQKKYKPVYSFLRQPGMSRYWLEFNQDWVWYGNCFPEMILSKDGKTISKFLHQESNDCRYKQMNSSGKIESVYLSKLWGATRDQYPNFDPKKAFKGASDGIRSLSVVDNEYLKVLPCIDMYNPLSSLTEIASRFGKSSKKQKSAILPVNYPSVNKTYYQVPAWDGARLAGWFEIASKIPQLLKTLYNKAARLKYHIEIPESFFTKKYGDEAWAKMDQEKKLEARKILLLEMDKYLRGDDKAYQTFVSFFDYDRHNKTEYGRIKITVIEEKTGIDKELIATSAANVEILMAMLVHPTLFSAGAPGSTHRSGGGSGSDIREAYLVYTSLLSNERSVITEPLNLVRDYNRIVGGMDIWEEDIVFRFRDTVLTTLDKNTGTEKVVS